MCFLGIEPMTSALLVLTYAALAFELEERKE